MRNYGTKTIEDDIKSLIDIKNNLDQRISLSLEFGLNHSSTQIKEASDYLEKSIVCLEKFIGSDTNFFKKEEAARQIYEASKICVLCKGERWIKLFNGTRYRMLPCVLCNPLQSRENCRLSNH